MYCCASIDSLLTKSILSSSERCLRSARRSMSFGTKDASEYQIETLVETGNLMS